MEKLKTSELSKFKFIEGTYIYHSVINESDTVYSVPIHKLKKESIDKIVTLFSGGSQKLTSKDKVFILNFNNSNKKTIEEAIRQTGAKITQSFDKATVYVGNSNIEKHFSLGHWSNKFPYIIKSDNDWDLHMSKCITHDGELCDHIEKVQNSYYFDKILLDVDTDNFKYENRIVYTEKTMEKNRSFSHLYHYANRQRSGEHVFLTNVGIQLLYKVLSKQAKIISETSIIHDDATIINEDTFNTLDQMYHADDASREVANKIIYNCNIDQSYYYLVKLIKKHGGQIENQRKKEFKHFITQLSPKLSAIKYHYCYSLSQMDIWEFVQECIVRGLYTEEIEKKLNDELLEKITEDVDDAISSEFKDIIDIKIIIDYKKMFQKFSP
jgi:hypothetical protein